MLCNRSFVCYPLSVQQCVHVDLKFPNCPFSLSFSQQPSDCFLLVLFCFASSFVSFLFRFKYKGFHTIFLLLCLTSFTQYDNLWVHLYCCKWHYFIVFNDSVISHCIYVPHLLYPVPRECFWISNSHH